MAKIYIPDDRDLFFQHKTLARIHDPLERAKTNTSSVPSILGGGMFVTSVQYAKLLADLFDCTTDYNLAALGSPDKSTLLCAIHCGHLYTFPGLPTAFISNHCLHP